MPQNYGAARALQLSDTAVSNVVDAALSITSSASSDLSHVKAKASKLEQSSAKPAAVRARKLSETRS